MCCGYILEAPRRGASNEYPQHVLSRYKKNIDTLWLKKVPYQELCLQVVSHFLDFQVLNSDTYLQMSGLIRHHIRFICFPISSC